MAREGLYGQDILLDETFVPVCAANGEAVLSDGVATAVQDIKLRLATPLGGLFYDRDFGSEIYRYINDDNTDINRRALCAEVVRRLHMDPRVVAHSGRAWVAGWDASGVTIGCSFRLIDVDHPFNLVIEAGGDMDMVIKDVHTD
jgi:phage baseplate assembly protein W